MLLLYFYTYYYTYTILCVHILLNRCTARVLTVSVATTGDTRTCTVIIILNATALRDYYYIMIAVCRPLLLYV